MARYQDKHFQNTSPEALIKHAILEAASHNEWKWAKERGQLRNGRLLDRGGPHKDKRDRRSKAQRFEIED